MNPTADRATTDFTHVGRDGARRTGRRRLSFPGMSVLAEGEPTVWLAGGALVLCAAMILGLLGLLLVQGMSTFWPRPVVKLVRRDAGPVTGELTRWDQFPLTAAVVESWGPATRAAAEKQYSAVSLPSAGGTVGAEPEVQPTDMQPTGIQPTMLGRRLVRSGNYEITNAHFTWVSDLEIEEDGESYPDWILTVERTQWGRFYGEPIEYVTVVPRIPTEDEQRLAALIELVSQHRWQSPDDLGAELEPRLAELGEQLRGVQRTATDALRRSLQSDGDARLSVVLDGDRVQPLESPEVAVDGVASAFHIRWSGSAAAWRRYQQRHPILRAARARLQHFEKHEMGRVNRQMEQSRLALRRAELWHSVSVLPLARQKKELLDYQRAVEKIAADAEQRLAAVPSVATDATWQSLSQRLFNEVAADVELQVADVERQLRDVDLRLAEFSEPVQQAVAEYLERQGQLGRDLDELQKQVETLRNTDARETLVMAVADGQQVPLLVGDVVRAYPANQLDWRQKCVVYASRWAEFIANEPREANSEGGVFPAIWGTVAMTLIMCVVVVPFGVVAALYLREYATAGWMVSAVRIAINNLAGVPSIVFGVFGLGFFCYLVGAYTDGGPENAGVPTMTPGPWWRGLAVLAVLTTSGLCLMWLPLARPRHSLRPGAGALRTATFLVWLTVCGLAVILLVGNPFFGGFFTARLPNPTYGKGGLLWASLTLALLTLPVVIVATEEALAAVPNSLREGSYASGASKWQTIRRIVLPHAMPGIMTGMILAMARGAGEVAPLMLVGAVKMAPELPLDGIFPFLHGDRSFMHLGFHIYDLGFQSQNSDAAKPMVFTTTLLLIGIIASLNLIAIQVRSRWRKRFQGGQF